LLNTLSPEKYLSMCSVVHMQRLAFWAKVARYDKFPGESEGVNP